MPIDRTEEQELLKQSIERFLEDHADFDAQRRLMTTERGFRDATWRAFGKLGWLSIPFAADHGGYGGSPIDLITVTEVLGRSLVTEPFVAGLVLGGRLVERLGSPAHMEALLTPLMSGELHLALAYAERHAGGNPRCVSCRAERDVDGWVITGDKIVVLNGLAADWLVVTARSSGGERDAAGIEVFVVDAGAAGITRRDYPTVGAMRASDVRFDGVRVPASACIGDPASNFEAVEAVIDEAVVAFSAEAVGAMTILLHDTVEYTKARKQFGRPIAQFQALQFRMVDMWLALQQAESALYMAALHLPEGGAVARRSVSALKVVVSKAARFVGESAVQIHAGIGTSDELRVGHYFKRLLCIERLLGSPDYHLDRYASLMDAAAS